MKKKIFIILPILILLIIGAVFFVNQFETKKQDASIDKSAQSDYYIEEGAESMAKIAIPAVETYANQDITEPTKSRNNRLKAHFATDSPVFNREVEIRSTNSATKTTAKVISVIFSEGEGDYPNLIVEASLTNYFGENSSTTLQKYWITIKKDSDGAFIANDIGMFE